MVRFLIKVVIIIINNYRAKRLSPPFEYYLKRMNRYQLDVGLRKHKKNCGRRLFSFSCLRSAKFKYTVLGLNNRVEWEKLTRVCDYFHSLIVFLTPFVELKYGKRKIPVKLHKLTTREASDVITKFKSHARGRRMNLFVHIRKKISFTQREI